MTVSPTQSSLLAESTKITTQTMVETDAIYDVKEDDNFRSHLESYSQSFAIDIHRLESNTC